MIPTNTNRDGFALITVMLVVVIVALLATSAAVIGSAHTLGNRYYDRQSQLDAVALEGLEVARARINGTKSLYPADGYVALESGVQVYDAGGAVVPGVQRWTYVGPTGSTSGQYGVFGSVVSVARDAGGGSVVRRTQVFQESFAKYAYFTDVEPSHISFGGGDQIFGPVHTNDYLKIYNSGATFWDETKTAKTVQGVSYGTFKKGYLENVTPIAMPQTADLTKLKAQASAGGTDFDPPSPSGQGEAYMRIEFVALDLDGDGSVSGDTEGFFKVYLSTNYRWVSGDEPIDGWDDHDNCGHFHADGIFYSARTHPNSGTDDYADALDSSSRRCYLGGADSLNAGVFLPNDGKGSWLPWTGTIHPGLAGRADRNYLFPLSRSLNPSFKGVIFVDGKVIISGVLRGRVTLASPEEIIIGDDLTYATDPSAGTCVDLLGIFSGDDVVIADNWLNTPQRPKSNWRTYDDTKDEFVQGIVLALDIFTVEDYAYGDYYAEPCEGTDHGRGCLYLTGGIIQNTRGAVGAVGGTGWGPGYVKRYAYDRCGATNPPPYFPTTGHFARGQIYWVDPVGFNVGNYYAMLTSP
jgi:type II secretory pathway pseudopilin PulG